jgi:hypothetical protein
MRDLLSHKANRSGLPTRYQIVFIVPPIGLMLGSFLPLWFFARALAHALGIPDDAPVRDQPFGFLWLVLFLTTMPMFMFAGMVFGFVMNALILRFGLGWSWAMVRRAGICPHKFVDRLEGQTASPTWGKDRPWDEDPMYDPHVDDLMR